MAQTISWNIGKPASSLPQLQVSSLNETVMILTLYPQMYILTYCYFQPYFIWYFRSVVKRTIRPLDFRISEPTKNISMWLGQRSQEHQFYYKVIRRCNIKFIYIDMYIIRFLSMLLCLVINVPFFDFRVTFRTFILYRENKMLIPCSVPW